MKIKIREHAKLNLGRGDYHLTGVEVCRLTFGQIKINFLDIKINLLEIKIKFWPKALFEIKIRIFVPGRPARKANLNIEITF